MVVGAAGAGTAEGCVGAAPAALVVEVRCTLDSSAGLHKGTAACLWMGLRAHDIRHMQRKKTNSKDVTRHTHGAVPRTTTDATP